MKVLDWYIIKKFLGTFFFITLLLMLIACIFDVSEKIDDFLREPSPPLGAIIFDYYLNFIAYYSNLFSSLIIFISVILFTAKMAQNTEIVAILSSGVSFRRFMLPYYISATVLVLLSLWLNHFVLPQANVIRIEFENKYLKNAYNYNKKNVHRETETGTLISFRNYLTTKHTALHFAIERWKNNRLELKITSEKAVWDTASHKWQLKNFFARYYDAENNHRLVTGKQMDTTMHFTPEDFAVRVSSVTAMGYNELNAFIEKEKERGSDRVKYYLIEKHQRTAYPFATYVLTLIGVSIASRKVKGGIGLHLAAGLGLVMVYIFCMKITTVAATNAGLDPAIAVWIPNLIFLVIGIFLYRMARK